MKRHPKWLRETLWVVGVCLLMALFTLAALLVTNQIQRGSWWEFRPREEMDFNDRPPVP